MPRRVKRFLRKKLETQITQMNADFKNGLFSATICGIGVLFLLALRRDLHDNRQYGETALRPADWFASNNLPFALTMRFRSPILIILVALSNCGFATADPNPTPQRFWSF